MTMTDEEAEPTQKKRKVEGSRWRFGGGEARGGEDVGEQVAEGNVTSGCVANCAANTSVADWPAQPVQHPHPDTWNVGLCVADSLGAQFVGGDHSWYLRGRTRGVALGTPQRRPRFSSSTLLPLLLLLLLLFTRPDATGRLRDTDTPTGPGAMRRAPRGFAARRERSTFATGGPLERLVAARVLDAVLVEEVAVLVRPRELLDADLRSQRRTHAAGSKRTRRPGPSAATPARRTFMCG